MEYDKTGNLILWKDKDNKRYTYIPAKHVQIIRKNLRAGKGFPEASPVYALTREQIAFILKEMKRG